MQITVVHSAQERCGVREYGLQLDRSFGHHGQQVRAFSYASLAEAFDTTQAGRALLVHFEAGLADPARLSYYGRAARARGVRVVYCCHWYEDGYMRTHYEHAADRFVLHRNYASALPVAFIPLGCPVYEPSAPRQELRSRLGYEPSDIVMTTIGFLTGWKRLPEVACAMIDEVNRRFPWPLKIHFHTPWPFDARDSAQLEAEIRKAMATRASGVVMKLSTEFLPEQQTLDLAHASDVGFVFHGIHTHSVSAATKQFVSARTPVVVTNSSHASDIDRGKVFVETFDMGTFVRAVADTACSAEKREVLREGMAKEYERLNMHAVAARYVDLFKELGAS